MTKYLNEVRGVGFEPTNGLTDKILSIAIILNQNSRRFLRLFLVSHRIMTNQEPLSYLPKATYFLSRRGLSFQKKGA